LRHFLAASTNQRVYQLYDDSIDERRPIIKAVKEQERQMIPLGRRGEPDDVARWVVDLADPEKSWITGQIIAVDGGLIIT
jgi:NAD(P)-dependent dehydrogenase (short-subunit alcohol dehydrogenase family)